MKEQMKFVRKLPEPIEVQQEIPLRAPYRKLKAERRGTKSSFPCLCLCDTNRSARKIPRLRFR